MGGAGLRLLIRENIGGVILKRQDSVNRVLKVLLPRLQADLGRRRENGMHNLIQLQTGVKTLLVHPASVPATVGVLFPPQHCKEEGAVRPPYAEQPIPWMAVGPRIAGIRLHCGLK